MNRTVPTLVGIMIILMVAVLVVLIYDFRVTLGLAAGHTVIGTVGGRVLSGERQPADPGLDEGPAQPRGRRERISPLVMQKARGRLEKTMRARAQEQRHRALAHHERAAPARGGPQQPGTAGRGSHSLSVQRTAASR